MLWLTTCYSSFTVWTLQSSYVMNTDVNTGTGMSLDGSSNYLVLMHFKYLMVDCFMQWDQTSQREFLLANLPSCPLLLHSNNKLFGMSSVASVILFILWLTGFRTVRTIRLNKDSYRWREVHLDEEEGQW